MSVSRMINSKFWSDSFVVDKLNPLDRYLFLYFLTNEKTNICGVYEIPLRTISNETGIEKEEIIRMLDRLKGKVEYKDGWVCLVNFVKHQSTKSEDVQTGISRQINALPEEIKEWVGGCREGVGRVYRQPEVFNLTKPNLTKPNLKDMSSFNQFWDSYPKKENRKGCEDKWSSKKLDSKIDQILFFIENAKQSDRWKKGFVKAPLVFINQESWEDDITAYSDIKKTNGFIDLRTKK